jgi:hypothetical protein
MVVLSCSIKPYSVMLGLVLTEVDKLFLVIKVEICETGGVTAVKLVKG